MEFVMRIRQEKQLSPVARTKFLISIHFRTELPLTLLALLKSGRNRVKNR
jgi:hypothetical protein